MIDHKWLIKCLQVLVKDLQSEDKILDIMDKGL